MQLEDYGVGDPGAYDPYASTDLAADAARSFNRSAKSGSGGFGGTSAREMKVDILGEDTPGPGSYDSKKAQGEAKLKMPSSSFRSSSAQRGKTRNLDTPGAGAYNPNPRSVEASVANGGAGMRGHGKRFEALKSETGPDIGPGAYENNVNMGGSKSTISGSVAVQVKSGGSAFFTSDSVRELPY